jgi:hypothetical protein
VTIQYAASRKEPWVRDGIDRAIRVELSRDEYEWLEATAAVVFGRPGAPASDLLRVFVISAQQQMGADARIEREALTHSPAPAVELTRRLDCCLVAVADSA